MAYIHRTLEQKIMDISRDYSCLLLIGPRQVGKTTMLEHLMKGSARRKVTLDDAENRRLAQSDPALFLEMHPAPVLIDEVQYAPELFTYIKIYIDEHQTPGDFWLTGSQIFRLMHGVQESLAGRVALLHMSPLSQREMMGASVLPFTPDFELLMSESRNIPPVTTPELFHRLWLGSMPGLASGQFTDRNVFYSSYVSTYIERDVRDLSGNVDALKFHQFITSVAARTAQLLNYNALAEDADIDLPTAKSWVNILETLGIVFLLHPYSNNVLKRTIKTPKIYFYDTGLVCYLTRWSSAEVAEFGAMNSALLENYTVSEIMKSYQNAGLEPYIYFYRDRDAKEIDVLLEHDGKIFPLEIKKTASPDQRLTRVFSIIDKFPLQVGTGAILCMAEKLSAFDRDNLIVPIGLI